MEGNFKDNLAQVNGLGTQTTRVENWQKCGMRKAGNKIQKIKVHLPTTPLPTFPSPRRPNTELNYKAENGGVYNHQIPQSRNGHYELKSTRPRSKNIQRRTYTLDDKNETDLKVQDLVCSKIRLKLEQDFSRNSIHPLNEPDQSVFIKMAPNFVL
ncbi:hypothetical protein ACFE04_008645 [Oxalis oulophora]